MTRLAVEFPAEGTPIAYVGGIHVVKALKYPNFSDVAHHSDILLATINFYLHWRLSCLFISSFLSQFLRLERYDFSDVQRLTLKIIAERTKYFFEVWNYYEWTIIIVSFL